MKTGDTVRLTAEYGRLDEWGVIVGFYRREDTTVAVALSSGTVVVPLDAVRTVSAAGYAA